MTAKWLCLKCYRYLTRRHCSGLMPGITDGVGKQGDRPTAFGGTGDDFRAIQFAHIILLDDARGLTGRDGVPSVSDVKKYVESAFPQRAVKVEYDIMRITRRE